MTTPALTQYAVRKAIQAAKFHFDAGRQSEGWAAIDPVLKDMAGAVIQDGYNPLMNHELDSSDGAALISSWRDEIVLWRASNFEGPLPGQAAVESFFERIIRENEAPLDDRYSTGHVEYHGRPVGKAISNLNAHLFGTNSCENAYSLKDEINNLIEKAWLEEACSRGIPSHVHAEFWWVPGWNGVSLDDTEHLHLRCKRWDTSYIDEILPSKGLENFLKWVNVSSDDFILAAKARNPDEGVKLEANLRGFSVPSDATRPSMLTPADVVNMLENVGYNQCLPTVHAYVEVRELLSLDPRQPIELPLRNNKMHIGWHDTINGAGYMDTYPGTAVIDAMTLGFGWDGRGRYGINETYGLALSGFYCEPRNLARDPSLENGADKQHAVSAKLAA